MAEGSDPLQPHSFHLCSAECQSPSRGSDLEGGGGLQPGLAVQLHGQGVGGGDADAAALGQPDGLAQPHLQLPQVPAAVHCHQLHQRRIWECRSHLQREF